MANHDRRLDRLEEALAPRARTVCIWDNHKPGCVEREKARLVEAGALKPCDEIVVYRWQTAEEAKTPDRRVS
jgi:hypothetical protein